MHDAKGSAAISDLLRWRQAHGAKIGNLHRETRDPLMYLVSQTRFALRWKRQFNIF